jgi:hypothetical protein
MGFQKINIVQNRVLDDILANKPGTLKPEKNRKIIQKNDFWVLCPGLICAKMDPKYLEKKYIFAHSIPDVTPRKNKKVRSVLATICGVFR